jgi:hypothetical protein
MRSISAGLLSKYPWINLTCGANAPVPCVRSQTYGPPDFANQIKRPGARETITSGEKSPTGCHMS